MQPGISFTNMPYVLNQGSGCGQESVNAAPAGVLDGFTIVMGHEIEETVTDPGAEDVINGQNLGAWYDYGGYENADKCAWVGDIGITGASASVPGGMANIRGNDGKLYPVQSLWSNDAAGGHRLLRRQRERPAGLSVSVIPSRAFPARGAGSQRVPPRTGKRTVHPRSKPVLERSRRPLTPARHSRGAATRPLKAASFRI